MNWNPNAGVRTPPLSVAIISPGNRLEKITKPLATTNLRWEVAPDDPYSFDILLIDMVNPRMGIEVLKKWMHDAKLVYRMRGDMYREVELFDTNFVKDWLGMNVALHNVDGVVSVAPYMAEKAHWKDGIQPVGSVSIPVDSDDGVVESSHCDTTLRMLTLTNANYWPKVEPITKWANTIERFASERGGTWIIGAKGKHADRLETALAPYRHVEYRGYIDKSDYLEWANVILHPSNLDGHPNAILEGMASRLPVVTNDYVAFTEFDGPIQVAGDKAALRKTLSDLQTPDYRADLGSAGRAYIDEFHDPQFLGQQYVNYFERVVE